MKTVSYVNTKVNESTKYCSDLSQYSKPDFWEVANGSGDCEDYALAKRKLLIESGLSIDKLHLALCYVETGEYHAVLIVNSDDDDWVLDNRYPYPMRKKELPYKWDKIQVGLEWRDLS